MPSGDGLLVRVRAGARPLSSEQVRFVSRLSETHGNGQIELTRRANLQLRGVREGSLAALRSALVDAGLAEPTPDLEKRLTFLLVNPLSGLDPECTQLESLKGELEELLRSDEFPDELPTKFCLVLDGARELGDVFADVRVDLSAAWPGLAHVRAAGRGREGALLGACTTADVRRVVAALARAFSTLYREGRERSRALDDGARAVLADAVHGLLRPVDGGADRECAPHDRLAETGLRAGHEPWFACALPFGAGDARLWEALAELASRHGSGELRATPARTLLIPGVAHGGREALARAAEELGLVVDAGDPLRSVSACAGAPACASARGQTRPLARSLATLLAGPLRAGARLHVSGCEKSCATRDSADITLVSARGGVHLGLRADVAQSAALPVISHETLRQRLTALVHEGRVPPPMRSSYEYERNGTEIYRRSFAIIRSEAELGRFSPREERVAVRLIHTCGMVDLARDIAFTGDFAEVAARAIQSGAPILCDAKMIVSGVTRARLPANNELVCFLDHPSVPLLAREQGTTRSAAALTLWKEKLAGAVVAIGNAPTALFRLLELLDETDARPLAVIGVPVGFVGAAESKELLLQDPRVPALVVRGRRGGTAMAVAAINALANDEELP